LLPPFLLDLDAVLEQLLPPSEPPDGELPPVDGGTGDLSSATSKSSISSVVSKSTMVARDSWDLKKYSWESPPLLALIFCRLFCQASVSPHSSLSYSLSLGPSSLSDTSKATLRAKILATSLRPADLL